MKIFILSIFIFLLSACRQQEVGKPSLHVRVKKVDLGQTRIGNSYQVNFTILNKGTADLLIDTVTSTCGCSLPDLDRKRIPPRDSARLQVSFSPLDTGSFRKSLVIKSNTDSVFTVLQFYGQTL